MKYFTKDQIKEISQRLATLSVRDSDLEETSVVKDDDFLAIVQDMENRKISIEVLGEAFTKGEPGPPGPQGPRGYPGQDGRDGQDGQDGVNGINGRDGVDGFSPAVAVSSITGGHRVTITDATGTQTFDVMDGHDGSGTTVNVIDNLNSTSTTEALSANQGRVLKEMIESHTGGMNYQKVTSAEYEAMEQAGTLQSNILYVIVDIPVL